MKKYLTLIICFVYITNAKAQNLLTKDKTWSVVTNLIYNPATTEYKIGNNDTIVGADTFVYTERRLAGKTDWIKADILLKESNQKIEFLREINGNVNSLGLLYDFGMSIGDSAYFSNPTGCDSFLMKLDTIEHVYVNGFLRKKFTFKYSFFGFNRILISYSGIGSTSGLISSFDCDSDGKHFLVCLDSSNIQIYDSPSFNTCYIEPFSIDNEINQSLNLFSDRNTIKIESKITINQIKLIGINGNTIYQQKVNQKEVQIEKITNKGVYLLQLILENGTIETKKILLR